MRFGGKCVRWNNILPKNTSFIEIVQKTIISLLLTAVGRECITLIEDVRWSTGTYFPILCSSTRNDSWYWGWVSTVKLGEILVSVWIKVRALYCFDLCRCLPMKMYVEPIPKQKNVSPLKEKKVSVLLVASQYLIRYTRCQ